MNILSFCAIQFFHFVKSLTKNLLLPFLYSTQDYPYLWNVCVCVCFVYSISECLWFKDATHTIQLTYVFPLAVSIEKQQQQQQQQKRQQQQQIIRWQSHYEATMKKKRNPR